MKLLFKQRLFSWFDSYDIFNEWGETVYTVEGKLAWGKCLHILDGNGCHIATLKSRVFSFLPCFELYIGETCVGTVQKAFTFLRPRFEVDFNGWQVDGDFWEWEYTVRECCGGLVATVSKDVWRLTDTYVIDVARSEDALHALMLVLAIDAEKDSRNN